MYVLRFHGSILKGIGQISSRQEAEDQAIKFINHINILRKMCGTKMIGVDDLKIEEI